MKREPTKPNIVNEVHRELFFMEGNLLSCSCLRLELP